MANDDRDDDDDYEVGYRKPPEHTRFKPGRSGNPKGRPKKPPRSAETFEETFARVSQRTVSVMKGDRRIEIPKIEAIIEQMCAAAARGNVGAQKEVVRLAMQCAAAIAASRRETRSDDQTETDHAIIERHFRRRSGVPHDSEDDDDGNGGGGEDA
ncbi:MAG: DUF5681 domain-containing protein [Hyphomicrobiales bacterium]|nr:DUF5681 domain-containing protein [Hyphomicrobiales bacterium]